jgi:hypothetical protein
MEREVVYATSKEPWWWWGGGVFLHGTLKKSSQTLEFRRHKHGGNRVGCI